MGNIRNTSFVPRVKGISQEKDRKARKQGKESTQLQHNDYVLCEILFAYLICIEIMRLATGISFFFFFFFFVFMFGIH